MKHENSFDPKDEVPKLPENLKGTRAALFHILRQQQAKVPKPNPPAPKNVTHAPHGNRVLRSQRTQWDSVLAADDFQFLD